MAPGWPPFSDADWRLLDALAARYGTDPGSILLWPPWRVRAAVEGFRAHREAHAEAMRDAAPTAESMIAFILHHAAARALFGGGDG